jgi:hypothetical protein
VDIAAKKTIPVLSGGRQRLARPGVRLKAPPSTVGIQRMNRLANSNENGYHSHEIRRQCRCGLLTMQRSRAAHQGAPTNLKDNLKEHEMSMSAKGFDPAFLEPAYQPLSPELLVSTVLHLMSHYSVNAPEAGSCVKLACVIERHLTALAGTSGLSPVLQATCQHLAEQWAAIVQRALPRAEKQGFLTRPGH